MAINTAPNVHELVICANLFIRRGDKYLVLRRSAQKRYAPGLVHPVGGKVELGEDPFTAAVREVKEETGLQVTNVRLEAVVNEIAPPPDRTKNWLIFYFSADYSSGEIQETEEGELMWMTADEFQAGELYISVRPLVARMLDPEVGTVFATFQYDERGEIDEASAIVNVCAGPK